MQFLDREREMARLDALRHTGGLAVVYGRRRIGKTRLLVEWVRCHGGVYTVADPSAPEVQRTWLAQAVGERLPGFGEVQYRDWRSLLTRLARDARAERWRGPLVLDELPYLVQASPELPGVLQAWVDHDIGEMAVVIAGSSQRMMQGLVLGGDTPLYGRARELMEIGPLDPRFLPDALNTHEPARLVEHFAAWGGVPRYWELAADAPGDVLSRVDHLALDPLGPLHREPDRLIAEDIPPATEARPLLDAIGGGAHRVSEIAARLGRPATSMGRPLQRLQEMGLVTREIPFGDPARSSKRSVYRISDPFTRLWFRVVAPNRGQLAVASAEGRVAILARQWPGLLGTAWEDLCRLRVPALGPSTPLGRLGPWGPASRWWRGNEPEWDVVARSLDGERLLLGEVKLRVGSVEHALARLAARPAPSLPPPLARLPAVRALFVIEGPARAGPALLVSATELLDL